ncbi:MAG: cupin domain-containing protein [Syntrophales bacterium]|nr:cupin domain-containing protein [Syntrophales bacterium]
MKIIHYREAEIKTYSGSAPKGVAGRVVIGKADGAKDLCMRVFELEPGAQTGKHAHEWEHEVFIHSGKGSILRDGMWVPFVAENVIFIPGGEEHQLRNDGSDLLTFICVIPAGVPEM